MGAEVAHLRRLAGDLGLQQEVSFQPPLVGGNYRKELWSSHIFLLPSLRDSAGLAGMESVLAGCGSVVAECGGPGRSVTLECGYN
jgi:hypothetical protein